MCSIYKDSLKDWKNREPESSKKQILNFSRCQLNFCTIHFPISRKENNSRYRFFNLKSFKQINTKKNYDAPKFPSHFCTFIPNFSFSLYFPPSKIFWNFSWYLPHKRTLLLSPFFETDSHGINDVTKCTLKSCFRAPRKFPGKINIKEFCFWDSVTATCSFFACKIWKVAL